VAVLWAPLSVLPFRLSVRPSICPVRARNSKTKKRRKTKIGIDVPHGISFQFERSKVKVTGRKTTKYTPCIWRYFLQAAAPAQIKCGRQRRLHYRSTPLLGILHCRLPRPRATGRTAACNVGADISCFKTFYVWRLFVARLFKGNISLSTARLHSIRVILAKNYGNILKFVKVMYN